MNVYTTTVEDALDTHDGVAEVAVIGIPHDDWGEAVYAVVVPENPGEVTEDDILSFADEKLADYKKPKSVEFVDELSTTPYGKVDKKDSENRTGKTPIGMWRNLNNTNTKL